MWSHQLLFRLALETIAQGVVSKLGIKLHLSAWLVGWPSAEPASPSAAGSVDAAASPSGFTGGSSNCATNCATPVYGGIFRFSMGRLYGMGGLGANSAKILCGKAWASVLKAVVATPAARAFLVF